MVSLDTYSSTSFWNVRCIPTSPISVQFELTATLTSQMLLVSFPITSIYQNCVCPFEETVCQRVKLRRLIISVNFQMKIHQIFLFLIGIWMIYAWNRGVLFAHPEQKLLHRQTDLEKGFGFDPDNIIPKMFKYALLYFVQFISDPFNLTLVMMCVFSRIVLWVHQFFSLSMCFRAFTLCSTGTFWPSMFT